MRPVTPEVSSSDEASDGESSFPSQVENPWEEPVVIHAKRCVRPITPELGPEYESAQDDFERTQSAEPLESPWSAPVIIHAKRCMRPVTPELGPTDVLTHELDSLEPLGDAGEVHVNFQSGMVHQTVTAIDGATPLKREADGKRNIPSHRGRPRVAREVKMLLEDTDSDRELSGITLDARGINPRVERVMKGSDSEDDMPVRREGKTSASQRGRAAAAAAATSVKEQSMADGHASKADIALSSSCVVELRVSRLLLTTALGSDDEGGPASPPKVVSPVKRVAISPSEEHERSMQAFRSARKIAAMERKAMQLANCSDSDDDTRALQTCSAKSQRHAIEREVEERLPGKRRLKSSAASVTASELDLAEKEWVLVEEDDKPEPRPAPTTFFTPLRGSRRVPSRRPSEVPLMSPGGKQETPTDDRYDV